ncbi:hypothetical protein BJX96DRAFT_177249 [Aspergillus floccosus]
MDLNNIKQLRWESSITYDASNVISYNLAIGASSKGLVRSWEDHPHFHALPTFASIAVINMIGKVTRDMLNFLPTYQPQKHPHIRDVIDRRTGVTVVVGIRTTDSTTKSTICYKEWTSFLMGMSGNGASNPQSNKSLTARLPTRQPDAVVSHQTTIEQGALYRAATGEWYPMHVDPVHAEASRISGTNSFWDLYNWYRG